MIATAGGLTMKFIVGIIRIMKMVILLRNMPNLFD